MKRSLGLFVVVGLAVGCDPGEQRSSSATSTGTGSRDAAVTQTRATAVDNAEHPSAEPATTIGATVTAPEPLTPLPMTTESSAHPDEGELSLEETLQEEAGKDSGEYLDDWYRYGLLRRGVPEECVQLLVDVEQAVANAAETHKINVVRARFDAAWAASGCDEVTAEPSGDHYYAKDYEAPVSDGNLILDYNAARDSNGVGSQLAQEFSDRHDCGFAGNSGRYDCGR